MKALKTLSEKKYYKYGDEPWVQPVLTANGTIGGDSFAVWATAQRSSYPAYYAIIGNAWVSNTSTKPCIYEFYNKAPLRVSKIVWNNNSDGNYNITGGYFQGSKEGSKWTNLGTFDNNSSANATRTLEILNPDYYKYYRFYVTSATSSEVIIGNLIITATQQTIEAGTPEDYDFSEGGRQYYKYVYSDWTQPVLDSNGVIGKSDFAVSTNMNTSAYLAMDNNTSTRCRQSGGGASSNSYYLIYSNNGLKVQKIHLDQKYYGSNDNEYCGGNLYASVDGYNFELLATFPRVNIQDIVLDSNNYYNYFKLQPTSFTSGGYWNLSEITITATQRAIIEGTAQDYDYYVDNFVYKIVNEEKQIWHPDEYEYTEAGSYSLTLPEGDYEIEIYGGGGGAAGGGYNKWYHQSCGGGGAGFKGTVHLPNGTYAITVGNGGLGTISKGYGTSSNASIADSGGNSSFGNLIIAGGGKYGQYSYDNDYPGTGGTLTLSEDLQIIETITSSNGNKGNSMSGGSYYGYSYGGLSLYDNTYLGYGAGGSGLTCANMTDGIDGYVKITKINGEGWYSTVSIYKAFRSFKKGEYNGN